jgi:hypothetical protein
VSALVGGQPVEDVAEIRPGRDEPPHEEGDPRSHQNSAEQCQLQSRHRTASSRAFSPMNLGSGRPAAIRFIQTSTPPYTASITARTS